ncbi:MAG: hypothetical protein GWN71_05720, partial [Gammaproteobacteria bacterium]|nr:hypothetical protein [Gemmatimonadota bacterium]NIU73084.1 hypothetical protein [Gammaproteobacteria bacterium]
MTGAFAIPVAAAGRYRLRTEHVAYRPVVTRPFTVAFGDIVEVKIRVSRRTFDLEPLVVVGRRTVDVPYLRDYYDRVEIHRKAGRGRILTREELERLEGFTVRDVLRRERPFKDRRGRTCTPVFYWNGFAVEAEHIPVSNVEGIELYRSRENMTFYNGRGCGVVLVWNRPLREGEGRPHLAGQGPGRDVFRLGYGVGVSNPGTDVLSLNAMLEAEFMPI